MKWIIRERSERKTMKSGWLVRTDYPDGMRMYQVYRLKDANAGDNETNRETYAHYSGHDVAIQTAKELNAKEAAYYFRRGRDDND